MKRDLLVGLIAGLAVIAAARWAARPGRAAPAGVYQAHLDDARVDVLVQQMTTPAEETRTIARLHATLPDVRCEGMRLDKLIDYVAEEAGLDVRVDWAELAAVGVTRGAPTTVNLARPTAAQVLRAALAPRYPYQPPLAFAAEGAFVRVTTRGVLLSRSVTRVYDVRDLILDGVRVRAALRGPTSAPATKPAPAPPPAITGSLFGNDEQSPTTRESVTDSSRATNVVTLSTTTALLPSQDLDPRDESDEPRAVRELLEVISRVAREDGFSSPVTIRRYFAGRLVVTAPTDDHEQIAAILAALRGRKP